LTTEDGELAIHELKHQDKAAVRAFYSKFQRLTVGLEASGYSPWFEQLLEELGHEVWLGDASEIRRRARSRQKNDRRDAELIWELLVRGEFPRIHRPAPASREILRMLRYRHKLVKIRTISKNSLLAPSTSVSSISSRCQKAVDSQLHHFARRNRSHTDGRFFARLAFHFTSSHRFRNASCEGWANRISDR
jgi:hypothetical protein